MKNKNVKFIRRGGRIIPIQVKREVSVARDIARKGGAAFAAVGIAAAGGFASLYGAGRLHRFAMKTGSSKLNKIAKVLKFGGVGVAGIAAGHSMAKLDKRVSDEKSKLFNIGSQATTMTGIAAQLAFGYGAYRFGKKFEVAGKRGLNLLKKSNWKKIKNVRDI